MSLKDIYVYIFIVIIAENFKKSNRRNAKPLFCFIWNLIHINFNMTVISKTYFKVRKYLDEMGKVLAYTHCSGNIRGRT